MPKKISKADQDRIYKLARPLGRADKWRRTNAAWIAKHPDKVGPYDEVHITEQATLEDEARANIRAIQEKYA